MDLTWSMQIQVLNKIVMDWRWRATSSKVDPAQLKTSVTEYLLPKMELGLLFAPVTQKMCDAWLSTIVHTLCRGFSTVPTLNKSAFCLLAYIPDIFLRMQTSRITDLLVNLNSKIGPHGHTTRARFCQLMGKKGKEFETAVEAFQNMTLNTMANNRMSSCLRFMQQHQLELTLSKNLVGNEDPLILTREIEKTLLEFPSNHFFVY